MTRLPVQNLATWVFASFNPGGKVLPKATREAEAKKLLRRLDENGDGELDFAEFADWFGRTCVSIEKFRRAQANRATRGVSPGRTRSSTPPRRRGGGTQRPQPSGTATVKAGAGGSPALPPLAKAQAKRDQEVAAAAAAQRKQPAPAAAAAAEEQADTIQEEDDDDEDEILRIATQKVLREEIAAAVMSAGLEAVALVRKHTDATDAAAAATWSQAVASVGPPADVRDDDPEEEAEEEEDLAAAAAANAP